MRTECVPYLRLLFRNVYGKLDELSDGGLGYGSEWKWYNSCCIFQTASPGKGDGDADHGAGEEGICPRDIMTEKAFANALAVDMAMGCSTNSVLHLPAIARECGITLDLEMVNEISQKTPNICHLSPAGEHFIEDLHEAGGIPAVMNEISRAGLLYTDCLTCTCGPLSKSIENKRERTPR